ncbi:hypothetical protein P4284_07815 [Bacillus swezeyi]|uniref:ApeA N-terminal domain 1-containing protein n=1 Tax=Bacillus swezeyi TaxID=1925020 RepID=UPI002E2494EA|nr:hypothetical protein [Bacillus swezeyi]
MELRFSTSGSWNIEGSTTNYRGDLYINENEGGIVLNIRIPNQDSIGYSDLPSEVPFISGTTIDGVKITLVDCNMISTISLIGAEEIYRFQAMFMVKGVSFEKGDDILFSKVDLSIPGIIQWGNVSSYTNKSADFGKLSSHIQLNQVDPIEIYTCDEYTLSYVLSHDFPIDLMKEEITLKQNAYLVIESKSLQPLIWFINIAIKMKRIIEIAMGVPLGFTKMIAESPKVYWKFEEKKRFIPIEVTHALTLDKRIEQDIEMLRKHDFLFTLNDLLKKANFTQWQNVSSIMEPIIELYIDDLYNEGLSISRHFLNIIQALETYHSRMVCNGTLGDYKKRVSKIISVKHDTAKQDTRDFLLGESFRWKDSRPITLRNRIADLVLAESRFLFYTGNIHINEFPNIIAVTRNYYTHYNQKLEKKALKGEDLIHAYNILCNILEYYLLKELGFEEDFISSQINKRIQHIITSIDSRRQ